MKLFLFDLWHDLREKRLWPVAVLLLVGLAAVPLVLAKPAAEPAPPAPATASQDSQENEDLEGLAKVVLAEDKAANGSKLNLFDPSNPFRPPSDVLADDDEDDNSEQPGAGEPSGGAGGDVGIGGGTGDTTIGGGGTGGGVGSPSPSPSPQPQPQQQTEKFTYVIDATFKRGNRTRKIKGMERLEMLPNEENPLLLFLGVDANANNAVFLVDSRLETTGEGACKPRPSECSFLYLGAGSQHMFSEEDGTTYMLRIDQIRRVKLKEGDSDGSGGKAEGGDGGGQAHASSKKGRARATSNRRPFLPPFLADLVTVTEDTYEDSSSTDARR